MKKLIALLLMLAVIMVFAAQPTLASGDKVRGEKSEGPAYQNGECPFKG
jgi:hypothetical protein